MNPDSRVLELDTSVLEPWEIAARLDMMLAYPDVTSERMERLVNAACAEQIAVTIEAFPERRAQLISQYPNYKPGKVRVGRDTIDLRRDDVLLVGMAVLCLLRDKKTGHQIPLPPSISRRSVDQIISYLWLDGGRQDDAQHHDKIHDVERRKLNKRFPVAHLAAALQWLAQEKAAAGNIGTYDYQDLDFLRKWVVKAGEVAGYIRDTPRLGRMASKLIDIRWIEAGQVFAPVPVS